MGKDPPVLPPSPVKVTIVKSDGPEPNRRKNGVIIFDDFPNFTPNRTPAEVLRLGSFGGTYFRSIVSAVTGVMYNGNDVLKETCRSSWINGINESLLMTSQIYRKQV